MAAPLDCPNCGYDLIGLPEVARCPECGCPRSARSVPALLALVPDAEQRRRIRARVTWVGAAALAWPLVLVFVVCMAAIPERWLAWLASSIGLMSGIAFASAALDRSLSLHLRTTHPDIARRHNRRVWWAAIWAGLSIIMVVLVAGDSRPDGVIDDRWILLNVLFLAVFSQLIYVLIASACAAAELVRREDIDSLARHIWIVAAVMRWATPVLFLLVFWMVCALGYLLPIAVLWLWIGGALLIERTSGEIASWDVA